MKGTTEERDRFFKLMESVPWELDRAAYERLCAEHGVPAFPDARDLRPGQEFKRYVSDYGVKFGDWSVLEHGWTDCLANTLARRRLAGLEKEQVAARTLEPGPACNQVLCDCGHWQDPRLVMAASHGTACGVACYDRLSD